MGNVEQSVRGLFAEQILVEHRFYADPMPFDADIIRRQKVEILFELHRHHLSLPIIPQTLMTPVPIQLAVQRQCDATFGLRAMDCDSVLPTGDLHSQAN